MRNFFITGLPRSRTTWLAAWLTQPPASFCFHDALPLGCKSPDDLVEKFRQTGADYAGDSDSGIPFFFRRIDELFPEARYVVIERSFADCLASFKKFAGADTLSPQQMQITSEALFRAGDALEKFKAFHSGNPRVRVVRFEDLSNVNTARELWRFCLPGISFHEPRWREFEAMRIEPAHFVTRANPELLKHAEVALDHRPSAID